MKRTLSLSLMMAAAILAEAGLGEVRELLEKNDPGRAAEVLQEMLERRPEDPWLLYNRAVAFYSAKEFGKADDIWQKLAGWELPEPLREQVWLQIGNASFRIAEPAMAAQPDTAIARLEQSREAYRVVLSQNKRNQAAQQNLAYVEKQLEQLYVRLAQRLVTDARKEPSIDRAIEKLNVALDYQRNATALNTADPLHQKAEREIEEMIAARLTQRAGEAEKEADRIAAQKSLDQWNREKAQEGFEKALLDFKRAQTFAPAMQEPKNGEQRVTEKLANMFAQAGRQAQREGDKQSKGNPREAFEAYDEALQNFEQALAVKPDHQDALAGKKEVLDAMEQLHLREGDKMAKAGEQQLDKKPSEAAEKLLGALEHYEQAQAINPINPEIPPKIEHVQKLLPDALVAAGKEGQQRAEKAETRNSLREAVAHLERAEESYDRAQQFTPENQAAQQGQKEVQEDLERLRKNLAQQAEQQEQQQGKNQKKQDQPSFAAMLAAVKAKQQERDANARYQRGTKYQERASGLRNW
jgi:tetratricopeptide (TPR) repeat protein